MENNNNKKKRNVDAQNIINFAVKKFFAYKIITFLCAAAARVSNITGGKKTRGK